MLGSAAIDICHVACGRSDGYFEAGLYLWDVAAAGLIAERAGAVCTAYPRDEEHGVRFLCTNHHVHAAARALVEKHFKD
jgi:myo-inositol-1(or 4)-monophosphatase